MKCFRSTKQFVRQCPTCTNPIKRFFHRSIPLLGGAYKDTTLSSGTIYSLSSSAATKSAIAVIRISGQDASKALLALTPNKPLPQDRVASFRDLFHPKTKEKLDSALVLFFKGPKSFTGEDIIELHVHGGRAVIHDTLAALADVEDITLNTAKPGEFARRAFENGKLDLTKVEAIADLINAETQAQRKQAIRQLDGQLTHLYTSWRQSIIQALAHYEAVIDFGDDEQISTEVAMAVVPKMQDLAQKIQDHLNDGRRGERMRDGAQIAIVGPPNSGKSSLINILCNRQAAIVSPIPGTTRDVVEVTLNFAGFPVVLSDTAGIRASEDVIEQEGIHRAKQRFQQADLKLCMFDVTDFPANVTPMIAELMDKDTVVVLNKADLLKDEPTQALPLLKLDFQKWLKDHKTGFDAQKAKMQLISCKSGKYIPEFLKALEQEVKNCFSTQDMDAPLISRARHREQLMECLKSLNTFLEMVREGQEVVLAAEELRYAMKAIARITGDVDVEDILDIVFSDFCIGK